MRPSFIKPAVVLAVLSGSSSLALAQGEAKPAAAPEPVRTLLALEHGRCEDFLKSPKDQALLAALKLIPVRITEIMNTPGLGPSKDEIPEGIVELISGMMTEPARLAVIQQGFDDRSRMPKLGFILSSKAPNEDAAKLMMTRVENARKMAAGGMDDRIRPSQRFAGMNAIAFPPGTLLYGPRQAADGWRFEVMFGNVPDPDGAIWNAFPAPAAGTTPIARAVIDFPAATPVIEMFGGMASAWLPNGEDVMQGLRDHGVLGDQAMSVEAVWGQDASGMVSTATVKRASKYANKLGLVTTALTAADLAIIPADSTFASISRVDPAGTWARLKAPLAGNTGFDEVINEINRELGIDFENDLIASLGTVAAVSMSDTTGGNSLFSGVGFFEIKDPAKMSATLDKIAGAANRKIAEEMAKDGPKPGTVRIESWAAPANAAGLSGVRFTSLRAPGLPLPIEPTFAMAGKWLVVGLSPQSATAAAAHVTSSTRGLAANEAFASASKEIAAGAVSLTFINSAETMRDGYPLLQMFGSALTNFARSPETSGGARNVAQVIPTLAELRAGAKPMIISTRWVGDDLVMTSRGDASLLVNAAGALGTGDIGSIIFGAIIGGGAGHEAGIEEGRNRAHWEHSQHEDHEDMNDEPEMEEPADAPEAPEAPEPPAAPEPAKAPQAAQPEFAGR